MVRLYEQVVYSSVTSISDSQYPLRCVGLSCYADPRGNLTCLVSPLIGNALLVRDCSYEEGAGADPRRNISPIQECHLGPLGNCESWHLQGVTILEPHAEDDPRQTPDFPRFATSSLRVQQLSAHEPPRSDPHWPASRDALLRPAWIPWEDIDGCCPPVLVIDLLRVSL
jgi:hypothetical protein